MSFVVLVGGIDAIVVVDVCLVATFSMPGHEFSDQQVRNDRHNQSNR